MILGVFSGLNGSIPGLHPGCRGSHSPGGVASPLLATQLLVGRLIRLWQLRSRRWEHGQDAEVVFHQVFPLAAVGEALVPARQRRADFGRVLQQLQRGSRGCAARLSSPSSCWDSGAALGWVPASSTFFCMQSSAIESQHWEDNAAASSARGRRSSKEALGIFCTSEVR